MNDNQRGALFMMAATFTFLVNDALMKSMADALPPIQAVSFRSALAAIAIFPLMRALKLPLWGFSRRDKRILVVRSVADALASFIYITALFLIPMAVATAILQVLPLILTLAGAVLWREKVGWRRLSAILVGFGGVLLILQPGPQGLNAGTLLVLISLIAVVTRELLTRTLSRDVPSLTVSFYGVLCASLLGLVSLPWVDWKIPDQWTTFKMLLTTITVIIGYYFAVLAVRTGELAAVSPFRYTGLVFSMIIGFIAFGEVPEALTLVGGAIVAATGIFTLWREQKVKSPAQTGQNG